MTKKELISLTAIGVLAANFVAFPVFAEGPVNISIVEKVDNGDGTYKDWEDITGAMPGMTYSAIPQVKNNGMVPVSVRMCLSESATNASGELISLPANTFGITIDGNWILDNEGVANAADPASGNCYKYNSMVEVGAMTEPIFSEVTLSAELGNEYENSTFNLHLEAEAAGDESDNPDSPVNPDNSVSPNNPDTGAATNTGFDAALAIPYILGIAAVSVLVIHLLRSLIKRK